jgi:hypothetical protein
MILKLGSAGSAVSQLEQKLLDLGLYTGLVDGIFGGGVQAAVKSFQSSKGLTVDGAVGPNTWTALFPNDPQPVNPLLGAPIAERCLALTGSFETSTPPPGCFSGLTGDFDKMGLSFGALQWNLGQGSLQPLLQDMIANNGSVIQNIFHENLAVLENTLKLPIPGQLVWARSIQNAAFQVFEPWNGMLKALGRTQEFQAIEMANVANASATASQLCGQFDVTTERAHALLFDIVTQNGSISSSVEKLIRADYATIHASDPMDVEVARLQAIANRRAEASNPKYVEDVRQRKLCIANGQGKVHGIDYQLDEQFGIGLRSLAI